MLLYKCQTVTPLGKYQTHFLISFFHSLKMYSYKKGTYFIFRTWERRQETSGRQAVIKAKLVWLRRDQPEGGDSSTNN